MIFGADLETLVDLILVGLAVVILALGCRGLLKSGIRERMTYVYLTGVGLVVGVVEMLDVFEILPRNLFMREVVGEMEVFVILLLVIAMWQYGRVRRAG